MIALCGCHGGFARAPKADDSTAALTAFSAKENQSRPAGNDLEGSDPSPKGKRSPAVRLTGAIDDSESQDTEITQTSGVASGGLPPKLLPDTDPAAQPALPLDLDQDTDQELAEAASFPWWESIVVGETRPNTRPLPTTLEHLLIRCIENSSHVKVISEAPLIRETGIIEADAAFDWYEFVETRWDQLNDPVGNLLTTGGASRYKNNQATAAAGLRQRTRVGGTLEVSQRIGWQDTNSIYFVPNPQGTSRLSLSYTQPLLRGGGKVYNESLILLAKIDTDVAEDEFSRQLQLHLLDVATAYWKLYFQRGSLAQKQKSCERALDVLRKLQSRIEIDAVAAQVQRAEAEVATRQSEILRAELGVKNAESKIRALVNASVLGQYESTELIPIESPALEQTKIDLSMAVATAIQSRPEINQAIKQIQAGCVRLEMSKNELLPVLNLVTQTYVAALQGGGSIGEALADQFYVAGPGYSAGLQFEVPLGNRAARARNQRRMLELRQLHNQYETVVRKLTLEVEEAVHEVQTAYRQMQAQERAMLASTTQLDYLESRWKLLPPAEPGGGSIMLENLLIAQERVEKTEFAYLQARVAYNLSLMTMKVATGELLQSEAISWQDYLDEAECIKTRVLEQPDSGIVHTLDKWAN